MPIERPHDLPLGMPSPEALQMATDAIRRHCVLPETMHHPAISFECTGLAYLIQAYSLASARPGPHHDRTEEPSDAGSLRCVPTVPFRDSSLNSGRMTRTSRTRELVEA